jgi:hypothetical protein
VLPLHLILGALFGWLEREQRDAIEFLREENRVLKAQLHGRRLRLDDNQRRRLAVIGQRLGRRILADIATMVTPDTILRWHRELIARKWTYTTARPGRPGVQADIRRLAVRMATDNPSWGYTRIQGALKNLGHRVGRSTIAKILKEQGIPPSRERPMTWCTFLRAHWHALFAADFFTTDIWTVRQDDEDEEQPECDRRYDEEVGGHDLARVIGEGRPPSLGRRTWMATQVFGDGRLTYRDPQFLKFPMNPGCAPQRVRRGHPSYQRPDIVRHGRAASAMSAFPGPEQAKAAPMPRENRRWLHDMKRRAPAAPSMREPYPQHTINGRQTKARAPGTIHNCQLVP